MLLIQSLPLLNTCTCEVSTDNVQSAEAIDVPWGFPASFNASGVGSVTAVDSNTSRYRDVAAVVGDTVTIHWNHTAGANFSLWQIPAGLSPPALSECFFTCRFCRLIDIRVGHISWLPAFVARQILPQD